MEDAIILAVYHHLVALLEYKLLHNEIQYWLQLTVRQELMVQIQLFNKLCYYWLAIKLAGLPVRQLG